MFRVTYKMESAILRRVDEVAALKKILPFSRMGIHEFHDLAMRSSSTGWKEHFIHIWQQQSRCAAELEAKIAELGGSVDREEVARIQDTPDPEDEPADPISLDKILLLRCINRLTQIHHMYAETRRLPLSFDVRMVLQRQQLQARETLDKITHLYIGYSALRIHSTLKLAMGQSA